MLKITRRPRKDPALHEPSGPHLVLPVDSVAPIRDGVLDVYLPDSPPPSACVLLVHGLYPAKPEVMPRDSNFYHDYASHLARRGVVAGVVDHELTDGFLYPEALRTVSAAVEQLRSRPEVDGSAIGLWFFSGGGPLAYPFLADPQPWLRCVELTYPVLPGPGTPGWPDPEHAIRGVATVPTRITLVENEIPDFVGQADFLAQASTVGAPLEVLTVAGAGHGFDAMIDTPDTRAAVEAGLDWMVAQLRRAV